jgi:Dolichyl-phosphate-mannose-protein mannosyltransferase
MRSTESAVPNRLDRRDYAIAAVAAALILALRLLFLFSGPDRAWPHSAIYEGDAPTWARWATALSAGQPFEFDLPFRTPGVAWLLHLLGLDSAPFTTAKILWCVMSAATGAALYLVLARWFTRRAGIIATLLFSLSFGSFALATSLNNETPYALLVVCIVGATLAAIERPRVAMALALGALHAAALLLRAEHMLLVAMLVAYAAWRMRPIGPARVAAQCGLLVACMLACCAPWTLRGHAAAHRFNTEPIAEIPYASAAPPWTDAAIAAMEALPAYARADNFAFLAEIGRRSGKSAIDAPDVARFFNDEWKATPEPVPEWSLITMKGPLDFALANHPTSDGGFSRFGLSDAFGDAPPFSFARPSHARLLVHGYGIGLDAIRADPGRWIGQVGEKLLRFQDGATVGLFVRDWPHTQYLVRRSVDVAVPLRWGATAWSGLVLATLAAGVVVALRRKGGMALLVVVAYKLAVTVAFYGYARQAISISPVLFALTALAIDAACSACSRRFAIPAAAGSGVRLATGVATLAALAFAAYDAWSPPPLVVKSLQVTPAIEPKPEWGEGAFETMDKLLFGPPSG